jgi:hypothetical protein
VHQQEVMTGAGGRQLEEIVATDGQVCGGIFLLFYVRFYVL